MVKTLNGLAVALWLFVVFHFIANWQEWYYIYRWLDMPMHAIGGFLVAWLGAYLFLERPVRYHYPFYIHIMLIIGSLSLVAIVWEFHEFVADLFIKNPAQVMQAGVGDTMSDLFFALLGGTIFLTLWQKLLLSLEEKN